jgi:hypothetical protein
MRLDVRLAKRTEAEKIDERRAPRNVFDRELRVCSTGQACNCNRPASWGWWSNGCAGCVIAKNPRLTARQREPP